MTPSFTFTFQLSSMDLTKKKNFFIELFQDLMPEDIIMRGPKYGNFYIYHKSLSVHIYIIQSLINSTIQSKFGIGYNIILYFPYFLFLLYFKLGFYFVRLRWFGKFEEKVYFNFLTFQPQRYNNFPLRHKYDIHIKGNAYKK